MTTLAFMGLDFISIVTWCASYLNDAAGLLTDPIMWGINHMLDLLISQMGTGLLELLPSFVAVPLRYFFTILDPIFPVVTILTALVSLVTFELHIWEIKMSLRVFMFIWFGGS
ncbi:MAG: hypothetical protein WCI73_18115 [Phycisphaerae bacterium]